MTKKGRPKTLDRYKSGDIEIKYKSNGELEIWIEFIQDSLILSETEVDKLFEILVKHKDKK